jgi:REP element-mobilizing transposase RayT
MPHSKINIHLFCSNEKKISNNDIRGIEENVWDDIRNKAKKQGIILDFFYGSSNQLFCLIALKTNQTIQKIIVNLNKKSSFFINKNGVSDKFSSPQLSAIFNSDTNNEFDWDKDIFTMQVSESVFDRISNYNRIELESKRKKTYKVNDAYVVQYSFDKV